MALGKITGSVVADNTLTESNLAFGVSGQSAASAWATNTLKVNIIESDDSTAIQLNDGVNISGTLSAAGDLTVDTNTFHVDAANNRVGIGTTSPAYQFEIENTGANALLVLDRTDGAACFIEGQATRSAFGSVGATPLALAYNSAAVVTIGESGAITVNPDGDGYTFPTTDGSANQVLQTNGSGVLTFVDPPMGTLALGDSSSNAGSVPGGDALEFRSGNSITATVSGNGVTYALNDAIVINEISSSDSTAVQINDGVNISGTLSANTIDVNTITSGDSTAIQLDDGLNVSGALTVNNNIYLPDNRKIILGDSQDLEIYHSGNDTIIKENGTGWLYVIGSNIQFQNSAQSNVYADFNDGGSVELYYNGSKKIETTSTGVKVSGDAEVTGNLTVQGTTTYIETTNTKISDPLLLLSNGNSGGSDIDAGIMIERGSAGNNAVFYWNEGDDKFKAVTSTSGEDATAITDSATATIVANIEGNVTGTVSDVSNHDTDDIAEGSSNLYYTDARARASVSVTDAGGDGSLSYNSSSGVITYTGPSAAEVRAHISAGTGVTISSGEIAIGQSVDTTADVTFNSVVTNAISSSDSTAVQINDGLNVSGTVSADTIDVNTITSGDSTGININDTKLYVNGSTVLTIDTADEPALTTSAADVDHVIINDGGQAKRIALGNINISSFNNDANYASAASTGFVNSTVTTIPISQDSTATDYGVGEPVGVGTATDTTDAFGVPLGTTFDCMEPRGTTQSSDFGTEEAYVGA